MESTWSLICMDIIRYMCLLLSLTCKRYYYILSQHHIILHPAVSHEWTLLVHAPVLMLFGNAGVSQITEYKEYCMNHSWILICNHAQNRKPIIERLNPVEQLLDVM